MNSICRITHANHELVQLEESSLHPTPSLDVCLLCGEIIVRAAPNVEEPEPEFSAC